MKIPFFSKPDSKPTAADIAENQLAETERQLLDAHKEREHFMAQVAMLESRRYRLMAECNKNKAAA